MLFNPDALGTVTDLVGGETWSGEELAQQAQRRAQGLRAFMVGADNRFVIAHANTPAFFADLFAVWSVGACAVCVNPDLASAELENVVRFVGARALLVDSPDAASSAVPVVYGAADNGLAPLTGYANCQPEDPALMLFTSGTTGEPKGVVHSYQSILSRLALNQKNLGAAVLRRSLCVLPTHFGHGLIGNCLTPLLAGCDVFLLPGTGITGIARLGAIVDEHAISFMSSVPSFWKVALRLSPSPCGGSLLRINIGSAPLSADLWRAVIAWAGTREVANMYGITETANWIGGALASEHEPEDGLLGRPWGGSYAVRGEQGQALLQGDGEIQVQVPSLMTCYYQRPDLTAEVLDKGWYRTGDTGSIDADGVLRMTGRNKYMINRAGIKIYPEELDLLLEQHPAVEEACAFATADAVSGEAVAIAVCLDRSARVSGSQLRDWLRERIRPEALPTRIFQLDELPKTDRGKLNRDNVAAYCQGREQLL